MLNVASTESFEVVREQFFRSYLANAVAKGLPPAVVANPAGSVPSENNASTFAEPVLDAWQKSAKEFATALPGICKHYAHFNTADLASQKIVVLWNNRRQYAPAENPGQRSKANHGPPVFAWRR